MTFHALRNLPKEPGAEGERRTRVLREFGARNVTPPGELLAGFFRYFASELDYRTHAVREGGQETGYNGERMVSAKL